MPGRARLLALVLLASGCAHRAELPVPAANIVMMDWQGYRVFPASSTARTVTTPGGEHSVRSLKYDIRMDSQAIEEHFQALVASMTAYAAHRTGHPSPVARDEEWMRRRAAPLCGVDVSTGPPGPVLLLFIHGGLNSPAGTVRRASRVATPMLASGVYPLFVNWDSSLLSSYLEHACLLWQGHHGTLKCAFLPLEVAHDFARAGLRLPFALADLFTNRVKSLRDNPIRRDPQILLAEQMVRDGRFALKLSTGLDHSGLVGNGGILSLPLLPAQVVTAPLLQSMGTSSWELMRRRTKLLFDTDEEHYEMPDNQEIHTGAGLRVLLEGLQDYFDKHPGWRVVVVGHSMGTIVMNAMLRRFPRLPYERLVYMAAACTLRDYRDTTTPVLRRCPDTRVAYLILNDSAEWRDRVIDAPIIQDLFPRGSLLTWIDAYFETLDTPLDRTAGRYINLMRSLPTLDADVLDRVSVHTFNSGDDCTAPRGHGDFSDPKHLEFWRREYWAGPDFQDSCLR